MPAIDTLGLPALDTLLASAAALMNGIYLPAATPASVAAALLSLPALAAAIWLARRLGSKSRTPDLAGRLDEMHQRLQATEAQLADATAETSQLRQRVEQLSSRQESLANGNSRTGLRQAIALSRHGATTRQLVDTCGLSQGEAHLIQTLYGRPMGDAQPEELH
jgi:hypothetical protein